MKSLRQQMVDYLDVRRQFGYTLANASRWLGRFVDYCEERGEHVVTTGLAVAGQPSSLTTHRSIGLCD